MPTYEYQCTQCKHQFDIWQSVGEAPPACPECGSEVKKIFHVPRVIFKGSGFYVTDLRAEKSAGSKSDKSDKAEGSEAKAGDGKESTATETKSETKSDTKSEPAAKSDGAAKSAG